MSNESSNSVSSCLVFVRMHEDQLLIIRFFASSSCLHTIIIIKNNYFQNFHSL